MAVAAVSPKTQKWVSWFGLLDVHVLLYDIKHINKYSIYLESPEGLCGGYEVMRLLCSLFIA